MINRIRAAAVALALALTGGVAVVASSPAQAAPIAVVHALKVGPFNCSTSGAGQLCITDQCDATVGCTYSAVYGGNSPRNICINVTNTPNISVISNDTNVLWQLYRTTTCGGSTLGIHHHSILSSYPGGSNWPSGWDNAVHGIVRTSTIG